MMHWNIERKLARIMVARARIAAMGAATEVWEDIKRRHRLTLRGERYRQEVLAAYRPVEQYLATEAEKL